MVLEHKNIDTEIFFGENGNILIPNLFGNAIYESGNVYTTRLFYSILWLYKFENEYRDIVISKKDLFYLSRYKSKYSKTSANKLSKMLLDKKLYEISSNPFINFGLKDDEIYVLEKLLIPGEKIFYISEENENYLRISVNKRFRDRVKYNY